jgi:hypothetical protein
LTLDLFHTITSWKLTASCTALGEKIFIYTNQKIQTNDPMKMWEQFLISVVTLVDYDTGWLLPKEFANGFFLSSTRFHRYIWWSMVVYGPYIARVRVKENDTYYSSLTAMNNKKFLCKYSACWPPY